MSTGAGRGGGRAGGRGRPGTGRGGGTGARQGSRPGNGRGSGPARGTGGRTEADRRRRVLSQNYLRGPEAARSFLAAVRPDPNGLCLEVGAGEGILTTRLARLFEEVVAYEIDGELAGRLRSKLAGRENVQVRVADFAAAPRPSRPFQVVGNAPFSQTSPIIDWCLRAPKLTAATLITQREYARKRTGGFGRWSQLTVTTWPQVSWQLLGTIDRTQFRPVPRVDAAILRLTRRAEPLVPPARQAAYRRVIETGFSGVGGSVQASLRRSYPADLVATACASAGVQRKAVVAYVTPDQWIAIFTALEAATRRPPQRPARGPGRGSRGAGT